MAEILFSLSEISFSVITILFPFELLSTSPHNITSSFQSLNLRPPHAAFGIRVVRAGRRLPSCRRPCGCWRHHSWILRRSRSCRRPHNCWQPCGCWRPQRWIRRRSRSCRHPHNCWRPQSWICGHPRSCRRPRGRTLRTQKLEASPKRGWDMGTYYKGLNA